MCNETRTEGGRRRVLSVTLTSLLGLLSACAITSGPGKHNPSLGWKTYSEAAPYQASAAAFGAPPIEIQIDSVNVIEGRTAVERYKSYDVMVNLVIVNRGSEPLPLSAFQGRFQLYGARGKLSTSENLLGPKASGESNVTGPSWSGSSNGPVLEPGAQGAYSLSASLLEANGKQDRPVALSFGEHRVELRPK